ncbi:MAG: acyl-ACP thioesterase domain-containing protein [Butyricicoccaceae bacterium]
MVDLLTREYEVNYSHIDNRGIAKPSFLWNIMQDAATVHAEALHIGPLDLRIVWVLSRMKARLTRPLLPYERLRCETWCPGIKGASWYRSFSFFVDNKPVGDAQSMWVTLDPETHRIVRPSTFPEAEQYLHTSAESCLRRCPSCRATMYACIMFTRSVIRIWMSTIMSTTCVRSS